MTPDERLTQSFGTLSDLIRDHARTRPHHPALVLDETVWDAARLDREVDRVAAALQRDGVRVQDRVALCAKNELAWVACFVGALRAGAVVVPLPPTATDDTLAKMLADAEARLLFVDAAVGGRLSADQLGITAHLVWLNGGTPKTSLESWLMPARDAPSPVSIAPHDPFNLIYSSGTTGTPKGIVQPHAMRWAHVKRGTMLGYSPQSVTLVALPLWSNTTLVSVLPAMGLGGTVVLMQRFDAAGFLALAEHHRVTHAMLVPVLFDRLLSHPDFDRADLSSFEQKTCTSAPFPPALKAEVLRRWPSALTEFYGMSEGGASCMLSAHEHPDKLHTVGRPQIGHEIRLIGDDGRELPNGEVGEVVGRSPMMMTGYYKLPEQSAAAEWFDSAGRRFIRTGDLGRVDADGFLTLLDRKKDVVISGGLNIYSSDLEEVLLEHDAVVEVAVVGVPSPRWGETPVAFVVLDPTAEVTTEDLRTFANAQLSRPQRITGVHFVDALPRSAVGKVLKRQLRDAWRDVVSSRH